ncbi:hypothetical protein Tco_1391123, partial [Tanacetum coccineum]
MAVFTLNLYHDGVFVPNPLNYVGGGFKVVNDIQFEDKRIGDLFQVVTRLVLNPPKGLYYCLPGTTLTRGIRPLKIDKDMEAFIKVGYENGFKVELYIELYDYDVMGISNSDDLIDAEYKIQKGVRYPSYNPEADWDEFQLILSMKFENPLQFKNALADCGVKHRYQLWYYRSNYKSLFVYCGRGTKLGRCAGRRGINNKKKGVAEGDKTRIEALYEHDGCLVEHYGKLWEYRQAILDSNPGSTCHIVLDVQDNGQNRFHRLYMCFKGVKDGWLSGCRKVIGIDGCFITHVCKGELLTVMGKDENNQMYLIAWVVVDVENTNNWCWFLSLLADDLQLEEGLGLTIILDSHKGLIEAVKTWLPQAEHGHYARHLKMREIRALDEGAYAFLMERDLATWCKADFQTATRCASYENGILESFNAQILSARGKPIITMLEDIIVCIMQRIWHMSKKASECDDIITPSIRNHLEVLNEKQRKWNVFPSGYQVVEVRKRDEAYGVNLITRECGCRLWNLSGVPCIHVVAAFMHFKLNPYIRVSSWYSQSKWFDAYQFSIKPVYGSKMWQSTINTPLLLPIVKTLPGRPRKNRIKHPIELDDHHHVRSRESSKRGGGSFSRGRGTTSMGRGTACMGRGTTTMGRGSTRMGRGTASKRGGSATMGRGSASKRGGSAITGRGSARGSQSKRGRSTKN